MLAGTYLAIQYMLALRRTWFLLAVGVVAVAEPILLLQASHKPVGFAVVVLGIQVVGALVAFAFALRPEPPRASATGSPPAGAAADSGRPLATAGAARP